MSAKPSYDPIPNPPPEYTPDWANRVAASLNIAMAKVNNTALLTLVHGAASTPMIDARLSAFTAFTFTPLTANAAAIQESIYVTSQGKGTATIHHSSTANTDQNFRIGIHG